MIGHRGGVILIQLCLAVSVGWSAEAPMADQAALAEVRALLRRVPLIDGHNDAAYAIHNRFANHLEGFDFHDTSELEDPMDTDIARLRAGGVGGQFWSVWVPTELVGGEAVTAVLEQIDLVHRLVQSYPDDLEIALTAADVRRIHADGRIASLIGMEGGHSIGESLAVLRQLHALGARYMTLTHWEHVEWADAATAAPQLDGLSPFGEAVVLEMNRLGMMVDLSHVSTEVMNKALEITRAPVIFSHSGAAAINPHPRNVPDGVLSALPENGGLVMVNFGSFFVSEAVVEWRARNKGERTRLETLHPGDPEAVETGVDRWLEEHPVPTLSVADVADHVDHIRRVAGIDHVGLGSDFDGVGWLPEGLEDVSGFPTLLAELLGRGYTSEEVAKVAGLNLLRVMEEAERVAAELQQNEAPNDARIEELKEPASQVGSPDQEKTD
jgi:membrane dipeptidase